jgi:ABC-type antimicrobial peptide transport system permease subunit
MADPKSLASTLRQRVSQIRPAFRVTDVHTQNELIDQLTIRERVLAMVSLFFALVALALSLIGLYGVLSYSVLQRRREIGIRIALGAPGGEVAWSVVSGAVAMLIPGAIAGLAGGIACQRYFGALLYKTRALDPGIIGLTLTVTIAITFAAALPAIRRALRVDPSAMLRAE